MTDRAALGQLAWPEIADSVTTVLVPIGAVEQHGPHLPLDTDSRIAAAVAQRACARLRADDAVVSAVAEAAVADADLADTAVTDDAATGPAFDGVVTVAPELHYGASGEHEGFPGTVSLGHEALHLLLLEYGRSACRWADRLLFVNGHGGNGRTLVEAVTRLRYEGRDVAWFPCSYPAGSDAHAGSTETSVLLHLSPDEVRFEKAVSGNTAPVAELLDAMRAGGVLAVSENGVLGDPTHASAATGRGLVDDLVARLESAVRHWTVDDSGRLR